MQNRALFYTIIVSMGGFIFGFDASVISGTLSFIVSEFNLDPWQQGFVVASPTLGGILATMTAGVICDAIGRKRTLLVIAFLYLLSALASAFAVSVEMLIAARFIGGLAFCSLMIAPMYIAEISRPEARGKMVSVNQLNIVVGFSAAYFANYYILQLSQSDAAWISSLGIDENTWRWMLGLEVLPALAYFLLLFTLPESPRWLTLKNRVEEARSVLHKLFDKSEVETQLEEIEETVAAEEPPLSAKIKMLFSPALKLSLAIGLIAGISQQVTGVNAIYFYAPSVFEQSGVGTNAAFMQSVWIGIINVIFTVVAMIFIDRLGRKPLLIAGLTGVVISMSVCAYGFKQATYQLTADDLPQLVEVVDAEAIQPMIGTLYDNDLDYKNALKDALGDKAFNDNQALLIQLAANMNATLILAGILGFVASFAVSLGPVMWVLFSEIFPNQIRGLAISFVGIINSIVSFLVQLFFPWELANFGSSMTFMLYGIFAFVGLILAWRVIPETKGKTLEELEEVLGTHLIDEKQSVAKA